MATEILSSANTAATSSDRTVAGSATETIIMRTTGNSPASCTIEVKASDGSYTPIGSLDGSSPARQISGPVVYRIRRGVGKDASAVDVEA